MKFLKRYSYLLLLFSVLGCVGNMNPTGGNSTPDYPYFETSKPLLVKKIMVPAGTVLTYEEQFFKSGEQKELLSEKDITGIKLPEGKVLNWGGVPVTSIDKFFNSEMRGFTVNADFSLLPENKKTKFSKLWESCDTGLGITIKDTDDWSFNPKNIADVESCSVLYQRYFKDDPEQQNFLNEMYEALLDVK